MFNIRKKIINKRTGKEYTISNFKPIFIIGCARSGTTLLYKSVASTNIFSYPHKLDSEGNKMPIEGHAIWFSGINKTYTELNSQFFSKNEVKIIYNKYNNLGSKQILDKPLAAALWMKQINRAFPNAKIIHIVRHGRSVVNSMLFKYRFSTKEKDKKYRKKRGGWFGAKPPGHEYTTTWPLALRCSWQWAEIVGRIKTDGRFFFGDNYCEIKYEDLCDDTRGTMRTVLEFCELENVDQYLEKYPESMENRNYKSRTDYVSDEGWTKRKSILPEDEQYLKYLKPFLKEWGYDKVHED